MWEQNECRVNEWVKDEPNEEKRRGLDLTHVRPRRSRDLSRTWGRQFNGARWQREKSSLASELLWSFVLMKVNFRLKRFKPQSGATGAPCCLAHMQLLQMSLTFLARKIMYQLYQQGIKGALRLALEPQLVILHCYVVTELLDRCHKSRGTNATVCKEGWG